MTTVDFSIVNNSKKSILFIDETDYSLEPVLPSLLVKFPSLSRVYKCIIIPSELNVINSKLISYSDNIIDLPDGLYEFTYEVGPNFYINTCKKVMRLVKAKEQLKKILLNDIDKDTIAKYYKIDLYMEAAEMLAQDNPDKSIEYFDMITKELKKLNC